MLRGSFKRGTYQYDGEGYTFKLIDEKYHRHATTIIKEIHIDILVNETIYDDNALKELIVKEWFFDENEITREQNNIKRRVGYGKG